MPEAQALAWLLCGNARFTSESLHTCEKQHGHLYRGSRRAESKDANLRNREQEKWKKSLYTEPRYEQRKCAIERLPSQTRRDEKKPRTRHDTCRDMRASCLDKTLWRGQTRPETKHHPPSTAHYLPTHPPCPASPPTRPQSPATCPRRPLP